MGRAPEGTLLAAAPRAPEHPARSLVWRAAAGTSWSFRDLVLIPSVFPEACEDAVPHNFTYYDTSGVPTYHSQPAESFISTHARFESRFVSFTSRCAQNVRDCYAPIGGVPWLPAAKYRPLGATTTERFSAGGLCDSASSLYNERHCDQCLLCARQTSRAQPPTAHILLACIQCSARLRPARCSPSVRTGGSTRSCTGRASSSSSPSTC